MKQFQVPQFIDVEDKILSFMTMRQFFTMLIPLVVGGICYFILDIWLTVIISIITTIISAIFAFYKPNGLKFSKFLSSFLSYTFKPRLYVWKREEKMINFESMSSQRKERGQEQKTDLKDKKGYLETGSKADHAELDNSVNESSDYLNEIMKQ